MVNLQTQLALPAGSLRHSIAVQSLSTTPDSFGQPQRNWTTILVARASIEAVQAREMYQNGQFTGQVTHTITLRWPGASVTIAPGMQVVAHGQTYKIQTVENVLERNRVLQLMCLAINESG